MSAPRLTRRLPVSCEPCRTRKIRCSRDNPPCGTCIRRRVPPEQCVYKNSRQSQQPPESGSGSSPARQSNAELIARIERLEHSLQTKNQPQEPPCPTSVPQLDPESVTTFASGTNDTTGTTGITGTTGTLILSGSGHVRFLPITSSWRVLHRASQGNSFPDQDSAVTDTPSGPYPFGEHDAENRPNLLAKLPPTEYCDQLKDQYFQSFAPLFPILHSPTFHKQYRQFSKDPDQASLAWLALLFSILGTAVLALEHNSPLLRVLSRKARLWDRIADISERYYTAAMKCLEADRYLWQHNVSTLQALLNLIYGIQHSHGQTWTLLGLAYHLALSIGCHVDPVTFSLDVVEAEERRRCWLGLTTMLCNQNMSMTGFDIYQSVLSSRVLPPAEVWDEDIVQGQPGPIATSVGMKPISYLIRKSRLFQMSSEICNPVLVAQSNNPTVLRRLDAAIRVELNPLEQSYASMPGGDSSAVHTNLLLSFSHHLVLLLHSHILSEAPLHPPQHSWSSQCCMESARRILELHADFHQRPQFVPFYWYVRGRGAFHAFHAAFILVLIHSIDPQGSYSLEVVRLLQECHARLEASKAQSQLCTRTTTILGQILSRLLPGLGVVLRADGQFCRSSRCVGVPGLASGERDSGAHIPASQFQQSVDHHDGHVFTAESIGFPSLVRQIEPQQWIDPMSMDWDMWNIIIS